MLALNSCKEDTILDANLLSSNDLANAYALPDTITILTKTVLDDSLVTSGITGGPILHAIGRVATDDYFGKTNAGMYVQFVPPALGFTFPKKLDSAVLILPYNFTWGDTTATNVTQAFHVYKISDSLSIDSTYYSFNTKSVFSTPIEFSPVNIGFNNANGGGKIRDSFKVNGILRHPHVRIRLNQAFVDSIYNEAQNGSALDKNADFLRFFKGLYIQTDTNSGSANALYYFLLNGSSDFTRANIQFFRTDTVNGHDTVNYTSFPFDGSICSHYNRIIRNYSGSPVSNLLSSTANSDSFFVVQNRPGAAVDVKFPFIKYLPKQTIIRAELTITQVTTPWVPLTFDDFAKYTPPGRIFPVGVYPGGGTYNIQDRFPLSSSNPLFFIDGQRKDVVVNGKTVSRYVLNIPREVQKAIRENRDTLHLRINGAATYPGAYRLIGGGAMKDPNLKIGLKIYYSKI
jgi:hypothetical protein